jgi:hypothetical protein
MQRMAAATVFTLGAGTVMTVAGWQFHSHGWSSAAVITLPAGVLMSIAFGLALPVLQSAPPAATAPPVRLGNKLRRVGSVIVGLFLPMPGGKVSVGAQFIASVLSITAGWLMLLAGYAASAGSWWYTPPLIAASGGIIFGAFVAIARSAPAGRQAEAS